ncbi:hypothetical protein [Halostella salina]|uniref:hypothetical protein n=1 Tax=Halostella salina TaxID=1547897 RepID=UPI000EF7C539|nr:hypothetical protein [Halostella salina]
MTRRIVSLALVGLLLVSSLAGPAAAAATAPSADTRSAATASTPTATTATAQDNTSAVDYAIVTAASVGCVTNPVGCASGAALASYSTGVTAQDTKVSIHSIGTGEYESASAYFSLFGNYLQDTGTVASIDARNAIATAYEQGNTTTQADQMARSAIRDYYSVHQKNLVNYHNKQVAQLNQGADIAQSSSEIDDTFISGPPVTDHGEDDEYDSWNTTALVDVHENTGTLNNGTEITYLVPEFAVQFDDNSFDEVVNIRFRLDPLSDKYTVTDDGRIRFDANDVAKFENVGSENKSADIMGYIEVEPVMTVQSVTGSGLQSATVYDFEQWYETSQEIQTQASTVAGNYVSGFSEDIYTALDNGEISVSDLRGIDGQARHLIGDDDANVTSDRYETAALTLLGIAQPNASQTSTMVVEYSGYTDRTRNATTGEWEYTGYVENRTYQGLLFAQNVPTGGFSTGTTYNTTTLGGTVVMANETAGSQERFEKGEFVIKSMFDESGNSVNKTDYDEPQYDSYNSTEYITYINKSTGAWEDALSEEESGPSAGGGGASIELPDGFNAGSIFGGVAIMAVAAGAVVLVVLRG